MRARLSQLANTAFELLYGPAAPCYDWVSRVGFAGEWVRWQQTVLPFIDHGPVLEIGSGTGDLLPLLARQGLAPIGLERSARMIRATRRKYRAHRTPPVPLIQGDVAALPFANAQFGAVVATFPSHWIWQPAPWVEIVRVLQPTGALACVLGGELTPDSWGRRLRTIAYRPLYGPLNRPLPPPPPSTLNLRWERIATAHGQALLLVGRKPAAE